LPVHPATGLPSLSLARPLTALHEHPRVDFLTDSPPYTQVGLETLRGRRQVTDEYLVTLAALAGVELATFDRALGASHPEHVPRLD